MVVVLAGFEFNPLGSVPPERHFALLFPSIKGIATTPEGRVRTDVVPAVGRA